MKRVMVLGAAGMAGHVITEYFSQKPDTHIIPCARRSTRANTILLDVTQFSQLEGALGGQRPDYVINCVGLLVEAARDHLAQAILVNSYLPHFLSARGPKMGFRLIHISTDCVFSGTKGGYAEDDFRDGDTPYARTKTLGEVINDRDLTLRTSIIGPELKPNGSGLLHWFLMQRGEIKGFRKTYWSGVTTLELAKAVDDCITNNLTGLVNLTKIPKISKYDLLLECQKIWNHGKVQITPDDDHACDKSLITRHIDLPIHQPQDYSSMLVELREFMKQHKVWYQHYNQLS